MNDRERSAKLAEAQRLLREVAAASAVEKSVCPCCKRTRYDDRLAFETHQRIFAMTVKLDEVIRFYDGRSFESMTCNQVS